MQKLLSLDLSKKEANKPMSPKPSLTIELIQKQLNDLDRLFRDYSIKVDDLDSRAKSFIEAQKFEMVH